jgi:hypothetical protein
VFDATQLEALLRDALKGEETGWRKKARALLYPEEKNRFCSECLVPITVGSIRKRTCSFVCSEKRRKRLDRHRHTFCRICRSDTCLEGK